MQSLVIRPLDLSEWKVIIAFLTCCRDPNPLPEKERKPLTEVQQFDLHVDERAIQRSEFDTKVSDFANALLSFVAEL